MQSDSPASKTALMVAGYRALATRSEATICSDPWAEAMAGEEGIRIATSFSAHYAHMELWIAVRTAFIDEQLLHCHRSEGISQVVVLGAGLDTRAARLAREGLCFFEVDHPATQADKRQRLAQLERYPAGAMSLVPCDFESDENPIEALVTAGLDPNVPTFVIWEGVTPYLSEGAVLATASRIARGLHERSLVAFDFVSKRLAEGQRIRTRDAKAMAQVEKMGEPIRWGTDNPLPLLFRAGFRHVRTVSFEEACLSLTGTYDREREFRFQSMAIASKATWPRF